MWVCHHGMREIIYRMHKSHFIALCLKAELAWYDLSATQHDAQGFPHLPSKLYMGVHNLGIGINLPSLVYIKFANMGQQSILIRITF